MTLLRNTSLQAPMWELRIYNVLTSMSPSINNRNYRTVFKVKHGYLSASLELWKGSFWFHQNFILIHISPWFRTASTCSTPSRLLCIWNICLPLTSLFLYYGILHSFCPMRRTELKLNLKLTGQLTPLTIFIKKIITGDEKALTSRDLRSNDF